MAIHRAEITDMLGRLAGELPAADIDQLIEKLDKAKLDHAKHELGNVQTLLKGAQSETERLLQRRDELKAGIRTLQKRVRP